jgi:hypothetical protein
MGIFDKKADKPPESKPDFSNVGSGGPSTAFAARPPMGTIGSGKTRRTEGKSAPASICHDDGIEADVLPPV